MQADKTGKTPIDLLEEKVNEKGGEQYQELLDLFKEKTKFQSMVAQDSISDGLTR